MGIFDGRVAIVTGAARGLGRDYAKYFAADGAHVVLADVKDTEAAAADVAAAGPTCMGVQTDVTDRESVEGLMRQTREEFGRLDVLVNNAGLWRGMNETGLRDCPDDVWERAWAVNVTGTLRCYQAAVPLMAERGWGRIVNISSLASTSGGTAYGLTKNTVERMTAGMAHEVGELGITVNCIAPGISAFEAAVHQLDTADSVVSRNAIKRMGTTAIFTAPWSTSAAPRPNGSPGRPSGSTAGVPPTKGKRVGKTGPTHRVGDVWGARRRGRARLPDRVRAMTFANTEQAEFWAARASSWMSLESHHERVIGPAGRMAMDRLDPQPGQHIIDLGCGTGQTTVELAGRVAPGGQVIGVDIAAALLERAQEHAGAAGVDNVEFQHGDVQSSDIGRARFDGGFSRFGVMFFADPVAAFTNVHRSLKPPAVLSFACWQPVTSNEWMLVPAQAAASVLGTPPEMPAPDAPGPFSLSDPNRIQRILASAGFHQVDINGHDDLVRTRAEGIPEAAASALRVGAVQRMLEKADAGTVARVRAAIEEAMRTRLRDGEVALTRSIFLVRAVA